MSTIQIHSGKSQGPRALNHAVTTTALAGALFFLPLSPGAITAQAQATTGTPSSPEATDTIGKPPYNIVFLIVDQRSYGLLGGPDYALPGSDAIARHGVTFQNHYISSAMCSPSRASFLTGQPPQVTTDQMQYSFSHSLSPDMPNVGSICSSSCRARSVAPRSCNSVWSDLHSLQT